MSTSLRDLWSFCADSLRAMAAPPRATAVGDVRLPSPQSDLRSDSARGSLACHYLAGGNPVAPQRFIIALLIAQRIVGC